VVEICNELRDTSVRKTKVCVTVKSCNCYMHKKLSAFRNTEKFVYPELLFHSIDFTTTRFSTGFCVCCKGHVELPTTSPDLIPTKHCSLFLLYVPYFEKIKVGL
jgi:hypothetical protein